MFLDRNLQNLHFGKTWSPLPRSSEIHHHYALQDSSLQVVCCSKLVLSNRLQHWLNFVYKALLGELPLYISSKFKLVNNRLNLRSNTWLHCVVPKGTKTVGGKKSLQYFGPWSWNDLQSDLKLASFIPLRSFKRITLDRSKNICTCSDVWAA